jgi:hypothetical protein
MPEYQHGEAFCLMAYRADDGTEEETIWNSRDGVTPFVITLRSGKTATHVDWHRDRRVPDYQPRPGERIFVDLTEDKAREYARRNRRHYLRQGYDGVPSIAALARDYLHDGQAPDLIEVTDDPQP